MAKNAELLETVGDPTANRGFLLAYQKAVLFALHQDGLLDWAQLERSIQKLEEQFRNKK